MLEHMFSSSRPSFVLPFFCSLNSPTLLAQVPRESILNLKLKETKRGEKSICHLSVVPRATSYTNFIRRKKEIERSQHQQIKRDLTKKESREKRIKFNLNFFSIIEKLTKVPEITEKGLCDAKESNHRNM